MSDFICQFANCDSLNTPILITNKITSDRARFCCEEHAARYLLRYCGLKTLDRVMEDHEITLEEVLMHDPVYQGVSTLCAHCGQPVGDNPKPYTDEHDETFLYCSDKCRDFT